MAISKPMGKIPHILFDYAGRNQSRDPAQAGSPAGMVVCEVDPMNAQLETLRDILTALIDGRPQAEPVAIVINGVRITLQPSGVVRMETGNRAVTLQPAS